jgi:methyltransferase
MVSSRTAYLALIALLALERLVELGVSRRNARRAVERGAVEVGQGHFRVMAAMHALFLVACPLEVYGLQRPFPGVFGWICLGGVALAQGLRYWAVFTLGERWNVRILVLPHAAPVTRGPYRWVRHPNYVAVAMEILLVPLVHGAWLTAAAFTVANAVVLRIRIRAEEAALGPGYAAAFAGRPRFIPGST